MTQPTQQPEWEKEPEVQEWIKQGRTKEQIYGVLNFLTGAGIRMLARLKLRWEAEARRQALEEAIEQAKILIIPDAVVDAERARNFAIELLISRLQSLQRSDKSQETN